MSRLPLKARLTLAFTLAMAVVVAGLALFVYHKVEHSLSRSLDQGLRARAVDVANLANQADNGLSGAKNQLTGSGENLGQLIDRRGHVYDETPGLGRRVLLSPAQLERARRGPYFISLFGPRGARLRAFVEPITAQDQRLVLVVGSSLVGEQHALSGLRAALLIGGPGALLLAALGGWVLAGAALRPVERMRSRAARVTPDRQGDRLPVPAADDEIGRLGRTLNGMLERLEHARDRERQFLADASHELRTPLALLKTEIELGLDGRHSAPELLAALRSARCETDRLVQLAEDLLLLAQSDQGVLPVRPARIPARELAERVARRFSPRAAIEGRQIEIEAAPGLTLWVDPLRIEQAIGNLIDNALRHGAGTITLRFAGVGDSAELHVSDQGAGLSAGMRDRAFDRFSREEHTRPDRGAGLGLAIVAAIAWAHGGEADVGPGADVFLRLPGAASHRAEAGLMLTGA